MADSTITRADVAGRAKVGALVFTEPHEALLVARAIRHPWYRCQSLSSVAEHWGTAAQRMVLLDEALQSAEAQAEINRIVTVAAWPLRVMASIDADTAALHLTRFVELAAGEPHTLRRADALFSIAGSVSNEPKLLILVAPALVDALLESHGWRTDRLIEWSIDMIRTVMPEALVRLVEHHRPGSKKRRLEEALA